MEAKNMKTRLVGQCPICEGDQKLNADSTMVHHGYKRPGDGMIHGDCYAVGAPAYELSCEITKEYLNRCILPHLAAETALLNALKEGKVKSFTVSKWNFITRLDEESQVNEGDETYPRILAGRIADKENTIRFIGHTVDRLNRLINNWTLKPVRTFEEEAAKQLETKNAAKARIEEARNAKFAAKIAKIQTRIDRSLRTRSTYVLAQIFESAIYNRHTIGYELTKEAAIAALGRDHVWVAFGLLNEDGTLTREWGDIKGRMMFPEYHYNETKKFPWPTSL